MRQWNLRLGKRFIIMYLYYKNGGTITVYGDMVKKLIYFLGIAKSPYFPNLPPLLSLSASIFNYSLTY